jgi:hypothetical protein
MKSSCLLHRLGDCAVDRYDLNTVQLRLTHPALDFWIDVRVREFDGRWLAVADIADAPELSTGETRQAALSAALSCFGPELAPQLVERAEQQLA